MQGEPGKLPALIASGTLDLGGSVHEFGPYPHNYRKAAEAMVLLVEQTANAAMVTSLFEQIEDGEYTVVVEEINSGRDRMVQKLLENIHTAACRRFEPYPIIYLNSDGAIGWRTHLGLKMTKEQKKSNAKLSAAKREAGKDGELFLAINKKALGIKGKTTKKHLAVEWAKQHYKPTLKVKDNNEADAICIGAAYFLGATPFDGT